MNIPDASEMLMVSCQESRRELGISERVAKDCDAVAVYGPSGARRSRVLRYALSLSVNHDEREACTRQP